MFITTRSHSLDDILKQTSPVSIFTAYIPDINFDILYILLYTPRHSQLASYIQVSKMFMSTCLFVHSMCNMILIAVIKMTVEF